MTPRGPVSRLRHTLPALTLILFVAAFPAVAQIPREFKNLQVLPADIDPDSLVQLMRSFSFATGLRCEDCHTMGQNGSFQGAVFHADDKPPKLKARAMLRMVNSINNDLLSAVPDRSEDGLQVECKTCHRGLRKPYLLRTELLRVLDAEGVEAAEKRYRQLRAEERDDGVWDFGEWEMNELARQLADAGRLVEAAAMLALNEEFHPRSTSIARTLGGLYERLGRTEEAIAAYHRALGITPGHAATKAALRRLEAVPPG